MALLPVEPDDQIDMTIKSTTDLTAFGDGYVQVVPRGLRPDRQQWVLAYSRKPARVPDPDPLQNPPAQLFNVIAEFVQNLGIGGKFEWVPPHESLQRKFMIESYGFSQPYGKSGQRIADLKLTITEVAG